MMYPGEKTEFYGICLRPEVENFAIHMEQRLRANDHKSKNITWSAFTNSREYFVSRLREEIEELLSATEKFHDEAADVANFALMIALQASLRKMAGIESEANDSSPASDAPANSSLAGKLREFLDSKTKQLVQYGMGNSDEQYGYNKILDFLDDYDSSAPDAPANDGLAGENIDKIIRAISDAQENVLNLLRQHQYDLLLIKGIFIELKEKILETSDVPANAGLAGRLREYLNVKIKVAVDVPQEYEWATTDDLLRGTIISECKSILEFLDDFTSSPASDVPAQLAVKKIEWKQTITDHYEGFLNGECIFTAYKMWNDRWLVFGMLETIARGMISSEERDKGFDTLGEAQQAAQTALDAFVKGLIE